MAKRGKTNIDLLKDPHHRSILTILEIYGGRYGQPTPLQQKHILYILNKNHAIDKTIEKQLYKNTHYKKLINESIEGTNAAGICVAPTIKQSKIGPDRVDKILKKLVEIGWVERTGKKTSHYKYTISTKYYRDSIIQTIKEELDQWHKDYIIVGPVFNDLMRKDGLKNNKKLGLRDTTWELCGFPYELIDLMTKEDKTRLHNHLSKIKEHLDEILELKMQYIDLNEFYSLAQTIESNDELLRLTFNALHLGFYHLGYSEMNPKKYWQ